jgi:hypothetical protein
MALPAFTGRFRGSVWGMSCVLELFVDEAGCVRGSFDADGEPLEVTGAALDQTVRGVIRAHSLEERFAAFRARVNADGLLLEVRLGDADELPLEHVTFARLD